MNVSTKQSNRVRRHKRVRAKISGTSLRPRLAFFKSNKFISAQLIDDDARTTLASARGSDPREVGGSLAKSALAKKISTVVFDRGGNLYRGNIVLLAESARKAGLKF